MTADLLATGWRFHQAGDLPRAEEAYRQFVQREPGDARGWYLLGILCQSQGDLATAAARFQQALQLHPDFPEASNSLGYTLAALGRLDEAIACYHHALRLRPDYVEVLNHLGIAYLRQKRPAEAEKCCRAATRLRPEMAEAHNNLGLALLEQERLAEAVEALQRVVQLRPDNAQAHNNLGTALRRSGRFPEAAASLREALRLQPTLAEVHKNLGGVLHDLGLLAEAEASLGQALRLKPDHAGAYLDLGNALKDQGRLEEALAAYRQVLQLQPDHARAHWNSALVCVLLGDFERGWAEFEWRWQLPNVPHAPPRILDRPRWDGSSLSGRTILLQTELGLGDALHFVRYARLVQAQGARVIVQCQRPLYRLLARCPGIDHVVARGDPLPTYDVWSGLMSLPYHFKTSLETVPAQVPYLAADPALVERWRQELSALPGFKIGLAWQGSPDADRQQRSIPLTAFAPLAQLPGVQLVSLQKGPGSEQVRAVAKHWPLTDWSARLDEEAGPFMDTAAVMQNLDLVVTADTSLGHLAGALGVPVWVALPKLPDWRWLLEREDCPWYPTMRLFRQRRPGDWGPVFERIAEAVQHLPGVLRRPGL